MAAAGRGAAPGGPPRVAVITTLGCPYCKRAKASLREAGIIFDEIDLGEEVELLARVKAATGQATVPQVRGQLGPPRRPGCRQPAHQP